MRRLALVALLTVMGCTAASQLPADAVQKHIGSSGGSLTNSEGVSLFVPPGAVTRDTNFSIALAASTQPRPMGVQVGAIYEFGPEGETFNVPVTVTLAFDASKLPAGRGMTDVVVMRAAAGSQQYEVLPTRVVDAAHVEATSAHFSVFVPVVSSVGTGGGAGGGTGGGAGGGTGGGTGGGSADGGADGGVDGGIDGGSCVATCGGPALDGGTSDGGADCECSKSCGGTTLEVFCSGSGLYGCACVRDGVQVGVVTTAVCPGPNDFEALCEFTATDGGFPDGGTDGGFPDAGFPDGGTDAGFPDGGTDGGFPDGGSDGGFPDAGTDGGFPDGGTDGGFPDGGTDGGFPDGGTDGGFPDGGTDAGTPDSGVDGGSSDAGVDAGTPDAGANDGG